MDRRSVSLVDWWPVKELQRVLNTEVVSLLGVSVGFSDTDGDS